MKKIFLITIITSVINCLPVFGFSNFNPLDYYKKGTGYFADTFIINTPKFRLNEVRLNAVRDFTKRFETINNASWYKVSDGFIARFTENEIETKVVYGLNGNWHCTLQTYSENKMPFEVRDLVKRKYYDYNILVVYEITHFDNTAYIIKIEDSKKIKTLRISDGNMEVIGDYVRG